jgi:hypothetical protein
MSNAARGTFEELLNGTAPELAAIARRLREAIFAVDPAAVETVRLGDIHGRHVAIDSARVTVLTVVESHRLSSCAVAR